MGRVLENVATDGVPRPRRPWRPRSTERRPAGFGRNGSRPRPRAPLKPVSGLSPELRLTSDGLEVRCDVFLAHRIALLRVAAHAFYRVLRALCPEEEAVDRLRALLPESERAHGPYDGFPSAAEVPEPNRPGVALLWGLAVAFVSPDYLIRVPPSRGPHAGKVEGPMAVRVRVACGGRVLHVPRTHDAEREALELLRAGLPSAAWQAATFDLLSRTFVDAVYDKKTGPRRAASIFAGNVFDRSAHTVRDAALLPCPEGFDDLPEAATVEAEMTRELAAVVGDWFVK